jgi:hypothetical protein
MEESSEGLWSVILGNPLLLWVSLYSGETGLVDCGEWVP